MSSGTTLKDVGTRAVAAVATLVTEDASWPPGMARATGMTPWRSR